MKHALCKAASRPPRAAIRRHKVTFVNLPVGLRESERGDLDVAQLRADGA
jgi:hypothetical protein